VSFERLEGFFGGSPGNPRFRDQPIDATAGGREAAKALVSTIRTRLSSLIRAFLALEANKDQGADASSVDAP